MPPRNDKSPVRVVSLKDIDLADRTFEIRLPKRVLCGNEESSAAVPEVAEAYPLLWIQRAPYKVIRGFSLLEDLSADLAGCPEGREVEVLFLQHAQEKPSVVKAMAMACIGRDPERFSLTTLECARAVRRLAVLRCLTKDITEFLRLIHAPLRTGVRARSIARSSPQVWNDLESGKIKLFEAEALQQPAALADVRGGGQPTGAAPREQQQDKAA